jgi:hypothetical protein
MPGWRFFLAALILTCGMTGCCSYCDSTYASRHPVAVPAYGGNACAPCQPVQCCPCPVGGASVGAYSNSVPPPPPPPGQSWTRAPGNGCACP